MLMIILVGLSLRYHWPELVDSQDGSSADLMAEWPRPLGPLICIGV